MEIDATALKSKGFFQQIQKDLFSLRLCTSGGTLSTAYLKNAIEIAEKYGRAHIHFTTRQQIEIPCIPADKVEIVQKVLADVNIKSFIGGPRVRTVVACVGAGVCKFGKIETTELANVIHQKYVGRELPAKLKIAITGCKNNCAKVEGNDIGIRGVPQGYLLYFGGCFGHEIKIGNAILPVLPEKDAVLNVLDAAITFYGNNAQKGERLGRLLERVGIDEFKKTLETAL